MQKSLVPYVLAVAATLMSVEASALTLNGVNYKSVSSSTAPCPDGLKKTYYQGNYYCRVYKAGLSWNIPTTRQNGTGIPVSELAGYEVYWTRSSDTIGGTLKVNGGSMQTAALEVFKPDMYYFAVSAIDTKGLKSPLSKMVSAKLAP